MTVSKPNLEDARWSETAGDSGTISNVVDPITGKKDAGFAPDEQPPAETVNALFNQAYQWIRWLDAITNPTGHSLEDVVAWYVQNNLSVGTYAQILAGLTVGKSVSFGNVSGGTLTPPTIAVFVHNYAPTGFADAFQLRIEATTGVAGLTGLDGGSPGRVIVLHNVGATNAFAIVHEAGASTAANRFSLASGADLAVPVGGSVTLVYDSTSSRWRVVGMNW